MIVFDPAIVSATVSAVALPAVIAGCVFHGNDDGGRPILRAPVGAA